MDDLWSELLELGNLAIHLQDAGLELAAPVFELLELQSHILQMLFPLLKPTDELELLATQFLELQPFRAQDLLDFQILAFIRLWS